MQYVSGTSRWALTLAAVSAALLSFWACRSNSSLQPAGLPHSSPTIQNSSRTTKRWLFIFRDISRASEVDRTIALFPEAKKDGYNGIVCNYNVAKEKAVEFQQAAKKYGLEIYATVFGGGHDKNYVEGVSVKDAPYVVHGAVASHETDTNAALKNGDFEATSENKMLGWGWQDDIGITTFADHDVVHGGKTSLRMENIAKNANGLCRVSQPIKLVPHRQYHVSVWVKTENLKPAVPEIKVLTDSASQSVSWQTFHVDATQDWKQYDIVFNSFDETNGRIYLGFWGGKSGKIWWDDLKVEEIGLVNVIRRPGCPVAVKGENGTTYEEGRDFQKIVDPQFHPWIAYRGVEPTIKLTPNSRIKDGDHLKVSYYHPVIVYDDRVTYCLSEPKVFEDWRDEVKQAEQNLHPTGYFMSHDELRCMNQCALCRSKNMTAGELLAWNVHKASAIIREIRPDASIWVWNDMFDPMHNAVDHFFAVNGTIAGSWKGLDKDVGIVNWYGGLKGKNCKFFADLGLKQILSGYYDSDDDGSVIKEWYANTTMVPGIVGSMYTTWEDKYGSMAPWAKKAWGATR
ncbi:MAG: carbohydrate binding domain-containing protein [Chthonomonadales bacterium]